ncbi:hypothetical protein ACP70R_015932 [Stipagrostis hirtigluma subsp. patula]
MELPPWTSFLAVVLATLLFHATLRRLSHRSRNHNLPPGPRPWPVIGNLNLIGPLLHHSLCDLSTRYGAFMSLRLGSYTVVVGSSVDAARFFLKTNDIAFVDRPRTASGKYTLYNYSDMMWSCYGAYWRQARKLWQTELLSERQLMAHEHIRVEEMRAMMHGLHRAASAGQAVQLKDHLLLHSLSVVSRMVLGKKYVVDGGDSVMSPERFMWMMDELLVLNGALNIGDAIPWLNFLDLQGYIRRMKKLHKMFDGFLEHVLEQHNESRRREGDDFVPKDLVDLLLNWADDPNLEVPIKRDGVKALIMDLLTGGGDSASVTVEWAMSELLRKPEVLAKAVEEVDGVVGHDRLVVEGDIPSLTYLEAVVKETMRLHPVAPLLTPRLSRMDTSVGGYHIPAGTRVLINVWAIGRDPTVWDAPEEFRPERFVGSGIDVIGHDFELLPFGSGRRACPAMSLGMKMVQVTLANLLHGFKWRLPDGMVAEELSMEEKPRISVPRLVPLMVIPEPKLPAHLFAIV